MSNPKKKSHFEYLTEKTTTKYLSHSKGPKPTLNVSIATQISPSKTQNKQTPQQPKSRKAFQISHLLANPE